MNIIVSNHAIQRKYERFHYLQSIDYDEIKKEIIDDLQKYEIVKKLRNDIYLIKGKLGHYIAQCTEVFIKVITSYGVIYTNIDYKDISFKTKLNLSDIEKYIIINVLQSQDYILIGQIGSKKIMVINNLLLILREDLQYDKKYYNLLEKYNLSHLKSLEKINEIQQKVFLDLNESYWNNFINILKLNEFIYKTYKLKEEETDEEIKIYKKVLNEDIPQFPKNFWQDDIGGNRYEGAKICTKYLFEEILKWKEYDIINNFDKTIFRKYKLYGMVSILFNGNVYYALNNAYSNIKPWQLKKYKSDWYFNMDKDNKDLVVKHAKEAIEWLLSELEKDGYNITKDKLLKFDWAMFFKKYNLSSILNVFQDYKEFFKECFNVEFSDFDISRYLNYFEIYKTTKHVILRM